MGMITIFFFFFPVLSGNFFSFQFGF